MSRTGERWCFALGLSSLKCWRACSYFADIVPNHPVLVERFRAVPGVEGASDGIARVDANLEGALLLKPVGEGSQQDGCDSLSTAALDGVDPLKLAVAFETAG